MTGRVGGDPLAQTSRPKSGGGGQFADGSPALVANGRHHYLACWPDRRLLWETAALLADKAGLTTADLPEEVRLRRRGGLTFAFNYSDESWPAPVGGRALLGEGLVGPQDVAVWTG